MALYSHVIARVLPSSDKRALAPDDAIASIVLRPQSL